MKFFELSNNLRPISVPSFSASRMLPFVDVRKIFSPSVHGTFSCCEGECWFMIDWGEKFVDFFVVGAGGDGDYALACGGNHFFDGEWVAFYV